MLQYVVYIPTLLSLVIILLLTNVSHRSSTKNVFSVFIANIFIWLLALFFADAGLLGSEWTLFLVRLAVFFSAFIPTSFLLFARKLGDPGEKRRFLDKSLLFYISSVFFALFSFSDLMIIEVTQSEYVAKISAQGFLYTIFFGFFALYCCIGFAFLVQNYRKSESFNSKQQIRLFFIGVALTAIINIFVNFVQVLVDVNNELVQLLGTPSLVTVAIAAFIAITKHNFLDIRAFVARSIAYLLSFVVFFVIFVTFSFLFIQRALDIQVDIRGMVAYILLALVLSVAYPKIKKSFDRLTNNVFFRDAYDTQNVLTKLSHIVVAEINYEKLLKDTVELISAVLKPKAVGILIVDSSGVESYYGDDEFAATSKSMLRVLKRQSQQVVIVDELNTQDSLSTLKSKGVSVSVRLMANELIIGYLLIGPRRSGYFYRTQDINFLSIAASELSIALQNAIQFDEIAKFNLTLQQRIDRAVHDLRRTNDKLKALDQAKDDFISMASHQLRTPLTSVKGYVSMVLEGDAGPLNEQQRQLLEQSFTSSQRMVYLIADLLNVSRLRTGKFVIEAQPTYLPDVVQGELDQLLETARGRQLELSFDRPKEFPTLMLDQTKVRQVIMNFVDNAIYYTQPGGHVRVELKDLPKSVELTVIDDGIGVPKAEQHHLFTKFYRANNAKKARPDGTGLGLFMAKKVIISQGGAIIFRSIEGEGSTFGFTFPKDKLLTSETAVSQL